MAQNGQLGPYGILQPDYRQLYRIGNAAPPPAPLMPARPMYEPAPVARVVGPINPGWGTYLTASGPQLEPPMPPALVGERVQRMQEGGIVKPLAPFKGSVREDAPPFAGAVREGRWGPESAPQPPPMPEAAQARPMEPPQGAAPVKPISEADVARHESEAATAPGVKPEDVKEEATNRILSQHSATLDPNDRRVTRRINPDTGSDRTTGQYFVPGDPAHERLLEHTSDYDRDKLPLLQSAMARGGPFSFLYRSAEEEEPGGERPTAESRAREYSASTAEQRAEGEHEGQLQRVTMIPQQFYVTKPSKKKPRRILVEGFGNDSALNNSQHLFNAANSVGRQIPYRDLGFDFQRDIAGYMQNQQHGYRGDGQGPMIEANNVPNQRFLDEQAKPPGERYVPHLLTPDRAEFLHAAMNIVPSGTTRPESERPTFSENLAHLSRVNQGALGREGGPNQLREELDRRMPEQRRTRRNKKTGELEAYGGPQPFSKRVLESTYRAFRLDLLEHDPELLTQSIRAREGVPHEPHMIPAAPVARHTGAEFKIPAWQRPLQQFASGGLVEPVSEDPEVGAPVGEAAELRAPEQIKAAAFRFPSGRVYEGPYHSAAYFEGIDAGEPHLPVEHHEAANGYTTTHGRFIGREEGWRLAQEANQLRRGAKPSRAYGGLAAESVKGLGFDKPAPISQNPELGAPIGEGQAESEDQPQGTEFVSPSIREDMTYNAAKLALNKEQQQRMVDYSNRLENRLGQVHGLTPATSRSGIGQWTDGAEPTTISTYENQPEDVRRLSLAARGLHGGQKQVLSFRPNEKGPHSYYRLTFNTDKPEDVGQLLDKHGIQFRTFNSPQKGLPVTAHVIDTEQALPDAIEKLIKSGDVTDAHHRLGNAEFLGDINGADREEAANEYRRIIGEARENWRKASRHAGGEPERRGVSEPSADPPWQDLVDEAEENYQRLRSSDLFEKQQLAHDYARSEADRNQIPADQIAVRDRYNQTAVPWVARNPELDPNSMYSYLLGRTKFPSDKMTKAQIAEHVEKTHRKLDIINNEEHRDQAADMLFRDVMHSLAGSYRGKPNDAYGWYDRSVRKTIDHVSQIAPEIKTDPASNLAFRLSLAITSQGQKVPDNLTSTWHAYNYWKRTGRFPVDNAFVGAGGKEIKQILGNFGKMNDLWHGENGHEKLGHEKLNDVLTAKITKAKLKKDYGLDVSGEKVGTTVRGAMGLGPKIGAFFSNLSGHFDPITMDRWFARNMNFYTGDMFNFSEDALKKGTTDFRPQIDELREFLDTPGALTAVGKGEARTMKAELNKLSRAKNLTRSRAMEIAPTVYDWAKRRERTYMKSYGETEGPQKGSYHPDFATPENKLAKRIHENVNELADAPRNSAERDAWREIVKRTHDKLKAEGIDLTNADKQAVPWFDIKDLFKLAGANPIRNVDYLDAAYTLVRKVKNGLLPDLMKEAQNA